MCVCLHLGYVFPLVITATTLCPVATHYHMSLLILVRCARHYVFLFLATGRKHRNVTGRNQGVYPGRSSVVRIGYSQQRRTYAAVAEYGVTHRFINVSAHIKNSPVHARSTASILLPLIEPLKYAGVYVACYRDLPVLNSAGRYLRQTEYFLLPGEHQ